MKFRLNAFFVMLLTLLLVACGGGGGSGDSPTGVNTSAGNTTGLAFPLNKVLESARFLLFPNSQRDVTSTALTGTDLTNTLAYPTAYYAAIDAANERVSKATFRAKNGFGSCTSSTATEKVVVFGDRTDLGYGRRMCAKQNPDGCLAFMVDNYIVETGSSGGYAYSSLNVDAAVVQSVQRFESTSAIEYCDLDGTGGANGPKFVKFFVFDKNGNRLNMVNQDGLGEKAMPNICVNCHGGRGDRLTPTGTFPVVGNAASQVAGDTTSRLQVLKVHEFDFSTLNDASIGTVRSRVAQEADMKTVNQWIDATYSGTGDNEWDGAVAQAAIRAAYGGVGFPNANYDDNLAKTFTPDNWTAQGQSTLYQNVVAPFCMTCHILRGTKNQNDIAFTNFTQFSDYADRIKAHVYDRGNMPLAAIVFNNFWANGSTSAQQLAAVSSIAAQGATASLKPGRPIADPGPDRVINTGNLTLTSINSLFASNFTWNIVVNPGGATFVGSNTGATATISFPSVGTYQVQLTATGNGLTDSKTITVVVSGSAPPATPSFATDIVPVFTSAGCTAGGCHDNNLTDANSPPISYAPPVYAEVKSRVNFTDVVASPILRKPSGKHHGGAGPLLNFDDSQPVGSVARSNYDLFVAWIMAGAQP